ncbi:MAG: 2,3-diaminopropionate biosynthesis protein SbnB, partial [Halieaceae bacterium]|nr:2,3-diaminopropionate biosynthesis protein SbnB [Halieaceae bacterium]
ARMHRAGLVDRESVHAEFGEIITGKKLGREHADERIFFNPFGLAIEDLAVAKVVYDRAVKAGLGTPIHLVDKEWDVLF